MEEGSNHHVYKTAFGVKKVRKVSKRASGGYDIQDQKKLHQFIWSLITFKKLYVPRLNKANQMEYEMEEISTEKPIYLGNSSNSTYLSAEDYNELVHEVMELWSNLWEAGIVAWDFELYLQPDGRVAMVDFDKFGTRISSKDGVKNHILMPFKGVYFDDSRLFQHPCFPRNFVERAQQFGIVLEKQGGEYPSL